MKSSALSVLLLSFCVTSQASDDLSTKVDEMAENLSHRMLWRMLDSGTAPLDDVLYTYSGPVAWSKPEVRIQVRKDQNHKTEFIEMAQHIDLKAGEMIDRGIFDTTLALRNSAKHFIVADATRCPRVTEFSHALSALALEAIVSDANASMDMTRVMLDGGYAYNYYFGSTRNSSFSYTDYSGNDGLKQKIESFEKYLVSCGLETAITTKEK